MPRPARLALPCLALPVVLLAGCAPAEERAPEVAVPAEAAPADLVERGKLLAGYGGCHDCHTPKSMTERGPAPDLSRALSGHPEAEGVPDIPALTPPWMAATNVHMTAWAGPWGISFAANLTPDEETGYGVIDEATFVDSMRSGRHFGAGRPILPPMPWEAIGEMRDEDLRALYAYMRSLPPIRNQVPDPILK